MTPAQRIAATCSWSRRIIARCLAWRVVNAANDNATAAA